MGYLIYGELKLKTEKGVYRVNAGDVIYLTSEIPYQWENPGPEPAKLLWIKTK